MSKPARLILKRELQGTVEELCVTPYDAEMDDPRACAVPLPRDVADALSSASDEWFERFLHALQRLSPNRAMVVASIAAFADLMHPDLVGGDADPGFSVSVADSAQLLQLRNAIDAIGWRSSAEEERGDYLARLHQIREELAEVDKATGRALRAEQQVRTQRAELRRFNREARARKEGAAAATVMSLHTKAPKMDNP